MFKPLIASIAGNNHERHANLHGEGTRTVQRVTTPVSSLSRGNNASVTLRALYASKKWQVSNMLSFTNAYTPHNDSESSLDYADAFLPRSTETKTARSRGWGLNYDLESYTALSSKLAIDVEAAYHFSHNNSRSRYNNNDGETVIDNDASEDAHFVRLTPSLTWSPDSHNSIMPMLHGEYSQTTVDYFGNSPSRQDYKIWGTMAAVKYKYSREKWAAGGLVGWVYANTDLSGQRITDNYPQGNVFASFAPNDRHQLELTYNFGKTVPETYQKSPNQLQQDELMWYAGDPDLDNYWNHRIAFQYVWLPNNRWQIAADSHYLVETDRVVTLYTPTAPGGTMLRQYKNDGDDGTFMA